MATHSIIDNLNPYARRVATHLFRHFPDWATLATTDPNPNADSGALLLEIPANLSGSEIVLHIWSDSDELTVGLHTHHCHFADYDQRETVFALTFGISTFGIMVLVDRISMKQSK